VRPTPRGLELVDELTRYRDEAIKALLSRLDADQLHIVETAFIYLVEAAPQAAGDLHLDRDADAEAWIFVASGLLATVDHRLGGLLGDDLARVRAERKRWLHGSD